MSTTIIKEKKLRTPVFYAECPCCGTEFTYEGEDVVSTIDSRPCCGTEFTYEGEDVVSTIDSQIEGVAYMVRCPRCNYPFWADREIYTYKLK